ncbi:hypothetical protein ACHAXT_008458 [Thalassiosira profunda]
MPFFLPCNGRYELRQSLAAAEGEIRSLQDRARALEAELAGARRRPDAGGGAAECGGAVAGVERRRPPSPERDTQTNITACEDETPPRETSTGDPSTQQHKALQAEVASLTDGVRGLMVALDQMTTLNNELIEEKAALEATLLERDAGTSCASNSAPASADGGSEGAKKWAGLVLGEKVRFAPGTLPSPSEQTTSVENGSAFPLSPLSEFTASTFENEGDIKMSQANMAARNKQLEATVASLSARNDKLEAQLAKEKERSARRRAAAKERRRKLKHRLAEMSKKLREDLGDSLDVDSSFEN